MYTPLDWWVEYNIWLVLQFKFMLPAKLISHNDDMEQFLGTFSLNGIKNYSICRL